MGLHVCILASGSTGNAAVVKSNGTALLIDAGISMKRLEEALEARNLSCRQLDAILITHEHSDHIKGLGALARKYDLPIYANQKTWLAMEGKIGHIGEHQRFVFQTGTRMDFGELAVESYEISHDAAEPVGFCFYCRGKKLGMATDLGYVSPLVQEKIFDSDVLIMESNYDMDMLRYGAIPWNVKRRILGDSGHLSNHGAGEALCRLVTERTKRVYLAHLSRDHNLMDLAKLTVNSILREQGVLEKHPDLQLMETYHDRPTLWDEID